MDEIDKRIVRDCIDVGFDIANIRTRKIDDKSDSGDKYKKTISYMEEAIRIRQDLILMLHSKSISVVRVVDYITKHLGYNETTILLSASSIAREYNDDRSNIHKAIKELVTLDIIRKISDYIPNSSLPKYTYSVNFNYICNGSIHEIKKELLKQRKKLNLNGDGSKS